MEQIPEYIRPFYKTLLDTYSELEEQLAKEGRANTVIASKEAVRTFCSKQISAKLICTFIESNFCFSAMDSSFRE